jgi:signal transduction histidine kinase
VVLQVHAEQALPPVSVDPQRVAQVLRNLLANALRYTPAAGQVTVGAWACQAREGQCLSTSPLPASVLPLKDGAWLAVSVADTGPGIAAEDLPHIFERFYRGDRSRSRASGGTGLGLAIVRQLIEAHGGKVAVESVLPSGARFVFVLPVKLPTGEHKGNSTR